METIYFEDLKEGDQLHCRPVMIKRNEIIDFGKRFDPQLFHNCMSKLLKQGIKKYGHLGYGVSITNRHAQALGSGWLLRAGEHLFQDLLAVGKDCLHPLPDCKSMDQISKVSKVKGVINQVLHKHPVLLVVKYVLMMPKGIRPQALFIDKKIRLANVGDLSDPCAAQQGKRLDGVGQNLSGVHPSRSRAGEGKVQPRWCDTAQIGRIGKKIPRCFKSDRKELFLAEGVQL